MNAKSRTAAALLAAILTACTTPSAPTPAAGQSTGQAQPHNLIVFFTPDADPNAVSAAARRYGAQELYRYPTLNGAAFKISENKSLDEAERFFSQLPGVAGANRDRLNRLH